MKVIANPAFRTKATNPHQFLLYSEVEKQGVKVVEFSRTRLLFQKFDVCHIHWPDGFLNSRFLLRVLCELSLFFLSIGIQKARGAKVIWTAHNFGAHDKRYPRLEKIFWKLWMRSFHAVIFLSENSREAGLKTFDWLRDKKQVVIPRGHYKGFYKDEIDRAEALDFLEIQPDKKVLLHFGLIRPYKNLEQLLEIFAKIEGDDRVLVIVGLCNRHPEYLTMIKGLVDRDKRVRLELRFVPDDELQYYLRAADLAIFPYKVNQNSGAALAALSFDTPVLLPHRGSNIAFKERFGTSWVHTYQDLTPEQLQVAFDGAATMRERELDMSELDWDRIAKQTINCYEEVIANGPHS